MRRVISAAFMVLNFSCAAVAQEGYSGGRQSSLNITTATVVKAAPGRVATVSVIVAGAVGTLNDTTTTGAVAAANEIMVIPATIGVYRLDWPVINGIVVVPGAAQVVSVSYQ
jgi:hypothetical protein